MKYRITMNLARRYDSYLVPIYQALKLIEKKFGFEVSESTDIPDFSIAVNNEIVAYIAHQDGLKFSRLDWLNLSKFDYRRVFKFHYSPNVFDYSRYGKYKDRILPCGLYRWWSDIKFDAQDLLTRERSVDVVALMRWYNKGTPPDSKKAWVVARRTLISEAKNLGARGYNVRAGRKIPLNEYKNLLLETKIGFIWSASAYLGWKIPEFTQQGVVMITEPLGKDYPLANDVIFEDGVHCVFCDDPKLFGQVAIELLEDKERLDHMRKNVVELWRDKLAPEKIGEWYFRKIIEVY
ncbi:MAG: hypothetical protein ACTSPB_14280 [Candidatus Thorarchaeota archaeon]